MPIEWVRRRLRARAFRDVAARLGFVAEGPLLLRGRIGARSLTIDGDAARLAEFGAGPSKPTGRGIRIRAYLEPPLDLGLAVHPRSAPASADPVRSPSADPTLAASADEKRRLTALLTTELQAALLRLLPITVDLRVDDEAVTLVVAPSSTRHELLARARDALELADTVDAQRGRVPIAAGLERVKASWQAYAAERRFTLRTTPFGFAGELDGAKVSCHAKRQPDKSLAAVVRVALAGPADGHGDPPLRADELETLELRLRARLSARLGSTKESTLGDSFGVRVLGPGELEVVATLANAEVIAERLRVVHELVNEVLSRPSSRA